MVAIVSFGAARRLSLRPRGGGASTLGFSLGHGDLVTSPLALGLVVEALDGTLPDPPGPADCAALRATGASVAGEPGLADG